MQKTHPRPSYRKRGKKVHAHASVKVVVCVFAGAAALLSAKCVWRLSPASFEFAPQSLTESSLGFDHFLTSPPHPCCHPPFLWFFSLSSSWTHIPLSLSPSTSCLLFVSHPPLHLDQAFLSLLASSLLFPAPFWTYSPWWMRERERKRGRSICLEIKSAGRHVSTWIPTHLVIAVSELSDNSFNCLPSNLWQDWGGDGSLSKM